MTLAPLPPLILDRIECIWLLRRVRGVRDQIQQDMLALEERVRGGHDGDLASAHNMLTAEKTIAEGIITKLWRTCGV